MYTCRECERELNQATEVCPYCGTDLSSEALAALEREALEWSTTRGSRFLSTTGLIS